MAAVKELMHSSLSGEERCPLLYKRYTQLVQDHKLQERKIAEALRKQLEVNIQFSPLIKTIISNSTVCPCDNFSCNLLHVYVRIVISRFTKLSKHVKTKCAYCRVY